MQAFAENWAGPGQNRALEPRFIPTPSLPLRFHAFDLLATLVAVVQGDGSVVFANAALEDALGISRRAIEGSQFPDWFTQPQSLQSALDAAAGSRFATLRYDAWLRRPQQG